MKPRLCMAEASGAGTPSKGSVVVMEPSSWREWGVQWAADLSTEKGDGPRCGPGEEKRDTPRAGVSLESKASHRGGPSPFSIGDVAGGAGADEFGEWAMARSLTAMQPSVQLRARSPRQRGPSPWMPSAPPRGVSWGGRRPGVVRVPDRRRASSFVMRPSARRAVGVGARRVVDRDEDVEAALPRRADDPVVALGHALVADDALRSAFARERDREFQRAAAHAA